jgi:hypothetical protein
MNILLLAYLELCLAAKQVRKARQRLDFLPVPKAHTNKFYISDNEVLYIYL